MTNELLTPAELANEWGMKTTTLANWRSAGDGPKFTKIGGKVFYRRQDIQAYIASRVRQSTCETVAA